MKLLFSSTVLLASAIIANAVPAAYFTASGPQNMGSASSWGTNANRDADNAFELTFDFTTAVDSETDPILLWEAGGSGTGAALVMDGDDLHFFSGNSNDDVVSGSHGLTAGATAVQIVAVFDVGGGSGVGGDELLSIYVNGVDITSGGADANTAGVWDGGESFSDLGSLSGSSTYRYNSTSIFTTGDVIGYDTATGEALPQDVNIDFAVYQLFSGGGPADNTLANILVPVPETSAGLLLGLIGSMMFLRRRR